MKNLFFDCETTGLNPIEQDVIQLAYLIEIDGEIVHEENLFMQPHNYATITEEALLVHGHTVDELRTFQTPKEAHKRILDVWGKYVKKFDKTDKFTPIGYNGRFDLDFMNSFFSKCDDKYFGSWQNWKLVDPLAILYFLDYLGKLKLPDYKLETACKNYGIEIQAHDALSDIKATRELLACLHKKKESQ